LIFGTMFFNVCIGIGLSAACGFRVFAPLLVASVAGMTGHLPLSPGFQWLASSQAVIVLSIATLFEVLGYFIPWVDHALDAIATPLSVLAGVLAAASVIPDMNPVLKWSLIVIAGGGSAGAVQASTVVLRAISTAMTGGLANPVFAIGELVAAVLVSIAAILVPVVVVAALFVTFVLFGKKLFRKFANNKTI